MKEKNLLASVALFSELYNNDKNSNISSIIAEFIKGVVVIKKKYCLSSYQIKRSFEEFYDFDIPESVIRTVLFKNLKSITNYENKLFHFDKSIIAEFPDIHKEIADKNIVNETIFKNLKDYVSQKENKKLSDEEAIILFQNFNQFLFDNGSKDNYSSHISSFIIKNETNSEFVKCLNSIREGLILYQGIKYTADIYNLGKWDSDLCIYLNTEYLFSALGYNGILYQEIFNDFYTLVSEINNNNENDKIQLKYFSETKDEIDRFFSTAESIIKGCKLLKPWVTAMKMITDNCATPSEVMIEKVKFYEKLDKIGITIQEFEINVDDYSDFNIYDKDVVEELKNVAIDKRKDFDESSCNHFFRIFTKINYFRKGRNNYPFEKIGHIFITDSGFAKYLGHNNKVKFGEFDTSFAKDIDFVTTRFWIKLKKGFSKKSELPKSFNVLSKAKIILASHINNSLTDSYNKLVKDKDEGRLSDEEALLRSYALRNKPNLPEDITSCNIDSTFEFLNNEEYLNNVYREKERKDALLKQTELENQKLKQRLDDFDKFKEEYEDIKKELSRRDKLVKEKEEKEEREKRKIEFEIGQENFAISKWKITLKNSIKDFFFSASIFIFTFVVVLSGLLFRFNDTFKTWISALGNYQFIVWVFYALILTSEVIGRSYLFDKKRIKGGLFFFNILLKYKSSKDNIIVEAKYEFEVTNSK